MSMSSNHENGNGNSVGSSEGSYSLRWNSFQSHFTKGMGKLLEDDEFTDVTLACDGQYLKAHKVLLSLCSPYFKRLFQVSGNDKSGTTIVILGNVRFMDLENIIRFVYHGQTNVSQSDLSRFLRAGELLQIEGLAQTQLPKQDADDDVVALPTTPSSRVHPVLPNDSTRSNSKVSSDRSSSKRTILRQQSHSEVPNLVDGQQNHPRNKRIKIVSTSSVAPTLHSLAAVTRNVSPAPVAQSSGVAVEEITDPLNTESGYSSGLTAESAVNSHIVCQERDPLGTDESPEAVNPHQPRIRDLHQFSLSSHPQSNDRRFEESQNNNGHYGNSSVMEASNGLYGSQSQHGEMLDTSSHEHQSVSMYGNKDPKLKNRRNRVPQNQNSSMEMQMDIADNSGHHFLLNGGDGSFLDGTDDQSFSASPSYDWIETEDSRFLCTLCGKSYRSKNVLYNHRSVYHRSENKKNSA